MTDFHMPDSFYEPPDEFESKGCVDDCILDHDTNDSECYTYDDALADKADRDYLAMKERDYFDD